MECKNVTSPADCCVWHANVHICFSVAEVSCHLLMSVHSPLPALVYAQVCGEELLCGPWITNNTIISTHTQVQCGPMGTYHDEIQMNRPGRNTIIFHMQIGNMHVVLGTYTFVEVDCKSI